KTSKGTNVEKQKNTHANFARTKNNRKSELINERRKIILRKFARHIDKRLRIVVPKFIPKYPKPLCRKWIEPPTFALSLDLHMCRHEDSCRTLSIGLRKLGTILCEDSISAWKRGLQFPRYEDSFKALYSIEKRYRLPHGYFEKKLR